MAVSLTTDIVLDVARAADPDLAASARERLANMQSAPANGDFARLQDSQFAIPANQRPVEAKRNDPHVQFEAMVLQKFIESMLPQEAENVYGTGLAGDMWRSMMAEKLGAVMAERGGIGIADKMLKDYSLEGDKKVALAGHMPESTRQQSDEHVLLSKAVLDDIQRRMVHAMREDVANEPHQQTGR